MELKWEISLKHNQRQATWTIDWLSCHEMWKNSELKIPLSIFKFSAAMKPQEREKLKSKLDWLVISYAKVVLLIFNMFIAPSRKHSTILPTKVLNDEV